MVGNTRYHMLGIIVIPTVCPIYRMGFSVREELVGRTHELCFQM